MPDLTVHHELVNQARLQPIEDSLLKLKTPIAFSQFKQRYEVVEVPYGDSVRLNVQLKEPLHQGYRVCANPAEVEWHLRNNYMCYLATYYRLRRVADPALLYEFDNSVRLRVA